MMSETCCTDDGGAASCRGSATATCQSVAHAVQAAYIVCKKRLNKKKRNRKKEKGHQSDVLRQRVATWEFRALCEERECVSLWREVRK